MTTPPGRWLGTSLDDIWLVSSDAEQSGYYHWDGAEWTRVADVVNGAGPADDSHTSAACAGPGLLVVTEYDGQIFTLDASGTRTDLGEPLEEPYSGSYAVTGYDGVIYAWQGDETSIPAGTSPLFRRDEGGWTEMPAPPPQATVSSRATLWATGPEVLWLFRAVNVDGIGAQVPSVFDGSQWFQHEALFAVNGDEPERSWRPVTATHIASTSLLVWEVTEIDTEGIVQVPLADPMDDPYFTRAPVSLTTVGGELSLAVVRPKDAGGGTRWRDLVEAWPVTSAGYVGSHERVDEVTVDGQDPYPSPPSYLADGTELVPFADGLRSWSDT